MNWNHRLPTHVWWIVQKDLLCEFRSRQLFFRMFLLSIVVAFLLNYQIVLPADQLRRVSACLCWVTICFASILNLGHSVSVERDGNCWETLLRYPASAECIFLAKLIVNIFMLATVQIMIVPFFALTSEAAWLAYPGRLLLIAVLANVGVTSLGTLCAASLIRENRGQGVFTLILLPLLLPVMLAASEATRLIDGSQAMADWSRWVQLLATFALVYLMLGFLLFPYLLED